jgi:hypothetical protein
MIRPAAALAMALAVVTAAPAFAAEPAPKASAVAPSITIDTPFRDVIADARTRAVLVKHMPGFVERMESEPEVMQVFGDSSLEEFSKDPHSRGVLTPEILQKFQGWFAEAQKPAA